MNLRQQASADLEVILEDNIGGFALAVTVFDPQHNSAQLRGAYRDIHQQVDPNTGTLISGRVSSIALATSSLRRAFRSLPIGISNSSSKPWLVELVDLGGTRQTYKITDVSPDELGVTVCTLQEYKWNHP